MPSPLDFTVQTIDQKPRNLGDYRGKVVLIVNVASECGLTPQYAGLEKLHESYADQGLAVLGFPANEFGAQEPGSDDQIQQFCTSKFGVKFDMFSKVVVKGAGQCELYQHLTQPETNPRFNGDISWNFEKFLISRQGDVVARFAPKTDPLAPEVTAAIEAELARPA